MTLLSFAGAAPSIDASVFLAPDAVVVGNVTIGSESSVWFHCVLRADINSISIGRQTNIQDGSLLHVSHKHALVVADRITVGHGAILHGCTVESDCLIAMGAIVLDGATIGAGSLVAAGSVVPPGMQVKPGSLVMGVPGKIIRELTAQDKERIAHGWHNYVGYAGSYKTEIRQWQG